jgi:hypothetical protein
MWNVVKKKSIKLWNKPKKQWIFWWIFIQKYILPQIFYLKKIAKKKGFKKKIQNVSWFPTLMKSCLQFSTFIFFNISNFG